MNVPSDLKYTKSHEWVRAEGDIATVGISDFAQSELGDIVFVEAPNVGRVVQAGVSLGSIESVKTVSDFYAPVSGEITEVNPALGAQAELVNGEPYANGWIVKIRMSDANELNDLLSPADYTATLG